MTIIDHLDTLITGAVGAIGIAAAWYPAVASWWKRRRPSVSRPIISCPFWSQDGYAKVFQVGGKSRYQDDKQSLHMMALALLMLYRSRPGNSEMLRWYIEGWARDNPELVQRWLGGENDRSH